MAAGLEGSRMCSWVLVAGEAVPIPALGARSSLGCSLDQQKAEYDLLEAELEMAQR